MVCRGSKSPQGNQSEMLWKQKDLCPGELSPVPSGWSSIGEWVSSPDAMLLGLSCALSALGLLTVGLSDHTGWVQLAW